MNKIKYFLVVQLLFSLSLCEIINDQRDNLLNGFLKYYNSLPNQIYHSEEGSLQSTQQVDDTTYEIEVNLRVAEISNNQAKKQLKCIASMQNSENEFTVISNHCEEAVLQRQSSDGNPETTLEAQVEVSEPTVERKPVQLVNEVQPDAAITSGEQFIAIPRDQPSAPCVGCASHVNPQAAGVSNLADLGVRHLDLHEPSVKHSLASVLDVERQVQVVNGVRYILTLSINFNKCTQVEAENCASSKICKITILVKPWVKLSSGGNYKAILANNCTEEWQFGDNGEVLPELPTDNNQNKRNSSGDPGDINTFDGDIQVKHETNVQSQPNQERPLTDEDIKKIQEQIITETQFHEVTESNRQSFTISPDVSDVSKQHVFKVNSEKHNENSIPVTESAKAETQAFKLNVDKKKAIDEMLDFFDFSGFKPKPVVEDVVPRVKRSYDYDLQVLSLAEDFHGIKNSIENARFMYEMAQAMVDYMNEMDMEVKNRAVKNVIRAEEEKENLQRFVYIQARVTIPCDKVECEPRDVNTQICNGVIDCSNENNPQILSTFCYNDNKESDYREDIREVSLNDPVLRRLAEDAVNKIESESKSQYAMRINKIASAITQVTSGTLTKFSVIVENIKCNKSVPLSLRINCTVLEQLGSKICDVIVHERHWLKEKKMSYSCTDRPADMRISKSKIVSKNITVDDPLIIEMLQEAIQYLESQSDKSNKQKIVNIRSISTQIIAGFLTKIEFVVGYTDCTDENYSRDQINKCELLKDEGLRSCKAQIWDRSWIMDGRQIEVSCDDVSKNNEVVNTRRKRSIDSTGDQEQQSLSEELDFKKLANESLFKFLRSSSSNQHYEVVKIDKAVVQDVSRKLIRIDFSISPTNCLIQNNDILSSSECNIVNPKNIVHCRSKILENNWIDKKQYFVKCNIKYQQQKISNTSKERNPSDAKYYQLAAESLTKYLHDTGNPKHTIVRVEKVTTQIISGLLTKIDFIVAPKNLSVSSSKFVRCHSEILEKHWMGTKAINISCQMKQDLKKMDHTVQIDVNNPKYMQIAVDSLQKYIKKNPESNLVRVAFVDKVERQGEKLKIRFIASQDEEVDGDTLCYAEVSETSESKSDIKVKCHLIGKLFTKADITQDDPNYYKYVQMADESLQNYVQKMNSPLYTVVSIQSVTVLWDEGIKTFINFTISPTDTENSDLLQGKQCFAQILEKPWLQNRNKKNIDVQCKLDKELYRSKREASNDRVRLQLGNQLDDLIDQDPTKPQYKLLAEESLRKYVIDSGITDPLEVAQVVSVSEQVVAGSLTRIEFLVSGNADSKTLKCNSEIWEKVWENFKQITVTCGKDGQRGKRHAPGGILNKDPTKPKYSVLAKESLQKYVIDSGITDPLEVAQVVSVSEQVVAGSLTRIEFLVSGNADSKTLKCNSEIWEKVWENFKQITVTCGKDGQRGKRHAPGGILNKDPTKPKYSVLAKESLQKYVIDSGITDPLEVAQVVSVSEQVVAGSLTRIEFLVSGNADSKTLKCNSEIWEKGWENFKQITVTCGKDGQRGKRNVPGGIINKDPTKPKYSVLAKESLQKYVIDSGITDPLEVAQVVSVSEQVVAGSLTRIEFLVSGNADSKTLKCNSEIWEKVWENFKQITVTCGKDGQRGKRHAPGGILNKDPTKPKYSVLAKESLQKYVIDSGITDPLEVAQVVSVSEQVVAGSLTRIEFLVSGNADSKTLKCNSEIWEKVWENFKQITVTCGKDGQRGKRHAPGGILNKDPTKPKYSVLAKESLQKYVIDSGITDPLEVAQVVSVSEQVVAGSLTRIEFLVSGNADSKTLKCNSEIWEKVWENFKQITVTCGKDGQRGKRHAPGGILNKDPTKPKYSVLAKESLQKYVIDSSITDPLEVAQVVSVSEQVVAGSLTRIEFLVSGNADSKTLKCNSEIWEKVWENFKQITVTCGKDGQRGKRHAPGGILNKDPTKPKYSVLAKESLQKYVIDSGITDPLEVAQVVSVSEQVVAGSLTRIEFLVSGNADSKTLKCNSEIWEKVWENFKQITVTCGKDGQRGKRHAPGGILNKDPTKPKYSVLAKESLQKYVIDSGITDPLEVAQVVSVSEQVVAGSLTRIEFLVSGNADSKTLKCNSEIWEKGWENFKQITVTCGKDGQRGKRNVPGGIINKDPTKPKYSVLAKESLQKYVIDSGITDPLEVAQVVSVSEQVVAGSLTRIEFLVSGNADSKTLKCNSEIWEKVWENFKQITVTCGKDGQRGKRHAPGGILNKDPTKPKYSVLAKESLQKYVIDSSITDPLEVAQVVSVSEQVVAGSLTRIEFLVSGNADSKTLKCNSEIWEKVWENFKKITVTCGKDGQRGKRHAPGGILNKDPTKPKYSVLAKESLQKYVIDSGITDPLEVAQVVSVSEQVVAGSLTRIEFLVSGNADSKTLKCNSEIWEKVWENFKQITVTCGKDGQRGKRHAPGGILNKDPTKPKYSVLAKESLQKYVIDSGITDPLEVAQVVSVSEQVVAGSLTRIEFLVSGNADSKTLKCNSEIWEKGWENFKQITVTCGKDGQRGKRNVPGGIINKDPTKPKYSVLAKESLQKYVIDSGITNPVEVARVISVSEQVVAGLLTRIEFLVSGSSDSKTLKCHSEIWEKGWENFKQITVTCENHDHRGKGQILGGLNDEDSTKPLYKVLAMQSLQKYIKDSGITQFFEVVQVIKVSTQVVAGLLTRIDFVASGNSDSTFLVCHSKILEQGWLNHKEIDVSCEKSDHTGKRGVPGHSVDQDPTNPRYKVLAEESLRKYVIDSGIRDPLKVAEVKNVSTQVVAGVLTRIEFLVTGSSNSETLKCYSEIYERIWENFREITVYCPPANRRVKRDLESLSGALKDNPRTPRYKVLTVESIKGNSSNKSQQHVSTLRGHSEEEQDPTKPEYKQMAQEALLKLHQKKSTVYHTVLEVQRVLTRVVSGLKYKIDFTAAPTSCSVNVSTVRARSCKAVDDVVLYCHTDVWDRPWLKQKKFEVQCNGPNSDEDDVAEHGSDNDLSTNPSDPKKNDIEKFTQLAKEASEKYLTTSNRKYVHRVTEIVNASEQVSNGTLINIDYKLSPTTCLRNETTNNTSCKLKQPLVVFNCNANIRVRQLLHDEKEIKVKCKKVSETRGKKHKRESGVRNIRQIDEDDDEIDEDTAYYYADRAVQHINDRSNSNNLHKLISIYAVKNSVQMGTLTVKMYIEVAETFCLRHHKSKDLRNCEEMNGLSHRLCLARLWPSPDDELVVRHVSVVCDDQQDFISITGVNVMELVRISLAVLEDPPENKYKLVHQGEPQLIPSLDSRRPFKLNFVVAVTNCSKDVDLSNNPFQCFLIPSIPPRNCYSLIWLKPEAKYISNIDAQCTPIRGGRLKRSTLNPENVTLDYSEIQNMVTASLEQLEMQSLHRYKQRVLQINSHSTKITSGKVTTIDFDVGYTSCLKYEWVANITSCNFLEHLPRRRCVAQIWERLWIKNGKNIDVNCVDDETPLESHIEFESAEMANELARQALKHIEAKYPHPSKQKVVRIFSLEKQVVAGIHYKMKIEVGFTDCLALSDQKECNLVQNHGMNKFCRVNVWIRPWTDHPPNFRVSCDFQEGTTHDLYHHVQCEHLFYNFLTTYSPTYVNNYSQMHKRFEIFKNNIKRIHELNIHEKGTATYGVTRFSDLTYEEFSATYMGLKTNLTNDNQVPMKQADIPNIKVPDNFDWREYDAVTDVKDQGSCGSCWAFSVTGNIEGQWKMQSGQLVSLSEQELVDCDKLDNGCNGGLPDNAYRSIEQMGGLELESDYPYEGTDDKCVFNKTLAKVQISSAVNITTNETGMAQWLVHNGPISIGINANAMQFYMGGISHPWKMLCNPTNLDHGVLIVGYGVKDYPLFHKKLPYWIIKNSWGKSWGEQGYYRVYRGDGTCGVNQMASSAVI